MASSLAELIGTSPGIAAVREQIQRLARQFNARRQPLVLIEGETGTGKGLVARLIHATGPRAARPFVDVNCAAIPAALIEAELFGYERGAFSDARQAKPGLLQLAHSGTIFLDEIGLLPEAAQAKLLRVIEERAVRRLGGTRGEAVDIAIVSATNEDLGVATHERRFRADLYHRLAGVTLALPALRERGDDVLALAEHYLVAVSHDYALPPHSFAPDARTALQRYPWPGNVRELRNVIERVALIAETPRITAAMLALPALTAPPGPAPLASPRAAPEIAPAAPARATEEAGERAPVAPASPSRELRRLAFLRARFASPADSQVVAAGRIDETLLDKIEMFGGAPTPIPGGHMLGVFGLEPVEDAPRRAANAAMAMQREVARDETGVATVLIHVAAVPIERRGDGADLESGAAREMANALDAMMRELPRPGIFVTEATTPLLRRHFDLAPAAPNLYRLVGPDRARLGEASDRLATFVGRQEELHFLTARFAAAARGHGEVVGVAGAAGLGKSRLLLELRRALQGSAATILEGHCVSHGSATAYRPIREVVSAALGIPEGADPREAERAIRAGLTELGLPADEAAPLLLHFLGIEEAESAVASRGREVVKARTGEIVRGLLIALGRRRPLVVALEDLHWIDRASEELLGSLVDSVPGAPVLLVTTYRPGYQPAWMGRSHATQIALPPLTRADGALVVRRLLGEDAVEESVVEMILERADGNPFFLEELAREVREQGGRTHPPAVPETVEAVLMARIDRLPLADRQLLQAASVVGRTVPAFLLAAATDLGEDDLRSGLQRLRAAEFLYERAGGPEATDVFSHVLTQEVAYESLPAADRCRLHGRIAESLERLDPAGQAQHAERLAHHCLRGRLWSRAVAYSRQAGHRALSRSAYRESAQCFEQALEALRGLPEGRERLELGVDLRCELRTVLLPLGQHERILNELHAAEGLAERLGDKARLARVFAYLADGLRLRGDHARALESGQRALALVEQHGDLALQVALNNYLGQICYDLGQYPRASRFLAANVERLVGALSQDRLGLPFLSSVHSRTWLVFSLSELGDFGEALRRAREAVELAESADHPFSLTSAFAGLGRVHLRRGHLDEAIPALERALELSRRWSIGLWTPILGSVLGYGYAVHGRLREGLPLLERAVEQQERIKQLTGHSLRLASLGEAYVLDGQVAAARALGPRALALAREQGERGNEAYALRLLAILAGDDDPAAAARHYQEAIALAGELGMRPLVARCLLDLGRLQQRLGQGPAAADTLAAALTPLRDMDMAAWRVEAEAALAKQ